MNTLASKIVIIALMQSISYNLLAHVELDYPQGGETFNWGATVTIQWHIAIPHNTLNWDLYFSPDGGMSWEAIQIDIPPGELSYPWIVPFINTTQGRVRVFMDNEDIDYVDESMDFTIGSLPMPPSIDVPASDTTIECHINNQSAVIQAWLDNHGGAMIMNNCGDVNWTNDFNALSNDCGATGSTMVTFAATDACGSTMTSAYLSIVDAIDPVMEAPATDLVVECDGQGNAIQLNNWLNSRGGAQASDACSNVMWTNSHPPLSNGCGTTGSASVIFIATDECGNSTTIAATFTIEDSVAPGIDVVAQNITIECGASNQQTVIQNWLENQGGAHASDICGNVNWTNNYSTLSNGCGTTGSASVIFTATDECGNSIATTATFTIEDSVAPSIDVVAQDTTIECGSSNQQTVIQNWLANQGGARASDVCGNVNWTNDFPVLSDTCSTIVSLPITFTAFDECGNSSITNATFTILGTTATSTPNFPDFDFKIYPNPVNEMLTIDFDKSESLLVHLALFDACGLPLWFYQDKAKEIFIPVSKYASGVYFLQVETAQGAYSRKVIIE